MNNTIKRELTLSCDYLDGLPKIVTNYKAFYEVTINFKNWDKNDNFDDLILSKLLKNKKEAKRKIKIFVVDIENE